MRKLLTAIGAVAILAVGLGVAPLMHSAYAQEAPQLPRCTQTLEEMSDLLVEHFDERPVIGAYKGPSADLMSWVMTVFTNPATGTWTITQSNASRTCIVTSVLKGRGGVSYQMQDIIEDQRAAHAPSTES